MKEELALTQGYGIKNLKRNKDANVDEERTIHEKENISSEPPAVVCGSHNFMSTFLYIFGKYFQICDIEYLRF